MNTAIKCVLLCIFALTLIAAVPVWKENSLVNHQSTAYVHTPSKFQSGPVCINPITGQKVKCPQPTGVAGSYKVKYPGLSGEPRMEKVTYFYYMQRVPNLWWRWFRGEGFKYFVYWKYGCASWYWRYRTYKLPVGCSFRYQY
jgi:hypothetical protein